MRIFRGKNPNKLYLETLKYVVENGELVNPRGLKTKEVYPAVM